jgi:hypothetical protein
MLERRAHAHYNMLSTVLSSLQFTDSPTYCSLLPPNLFSYHRQDLYHDNYAKTDNCCE